MGPILALIRPTIPSTGTILTEAAFFLVMVALSAFMSGSETALIGFSRLRRRQLVEEGHPRIGAVEALMGNTERFLITVLMMNTVINIGAAAIVTSFAEEVFDNYVVAISTGLVTFFMLTFGEIIPKAFAANNAEGWALRVAPVFLFLQKALSPIVWVYEKLMHALLRKDRQTRATFRSEEEIKTLISVGTEEGVLEEKEEDMLHSVIEFGETTAREIMVPRIDMTAVPADATVDHIKAFVLDSGFSRIPVYQGTVDNVAGILYVKDLLLHLIEKKPGNVPMRDLMREAYFVPESKKLDDLLGEMREKRMHMAVVIDEFGGTAGLVTLEDILEEVVGDIFDEYDLRTDPIRKLDEVTAVVDAKTHVADVNDGLDIVIPEEEGYDTVAGYIYHEMGRLGKEGEVVHGPGFDIVIEKVTNRRIVRVRVVKHKAPVSESAEGEASAH